MASTVVVKSGRVYVQGEVLQRRQDHKLSIFKAESGKEPFVFKRVRGLTLYDLSLLLAAKSACSHRFRMHIDCSQDEAILVKKTVTDVALGDFDISFKMKGGKPLYAPHAIRNAIAAKASDIFSFGLVVSELCSQFLYAMGAGKLLLLNDYRELVKHGILPEQEILIRQFCYFWPVPEGLLKHVDSELWYNLLKKASDVADREVKDQTAGMRFERWGEGFGPEAENMIYGMINLDPAARKTIDQNAIKLVSVYQSLSHHQLAVIYEAQIGLMGYALSVIDL
ncbi:kinase-like domain-containing protein [Xylaria bambusicola]|uniref:kinase-like domain-containing protein n=1 Tax=Xylaria bambusicola TaxID=326684 RepID=UPI0020077DB3|nr:kinase-like domain-containing protein [Xylaria bambusicola]KAI0509145.1 kinase-like domain-containing protein [Xylaria bambusicola]